MIRLLASYGPDPIPSPSIEYKSLSPMLIVFGVALLGVAVEAAFSQRVRRTLQPVVAIAGLVASLIAVILLAQDVHADRRILAKGAVAHDGPALFLEGLLVILAVAGVMLVAERSLDSTGGALVSEAAVVPQSEDQSSPRTREGVQTEAYPLMLFSVGGMMLFTAANTLLVSFIALEVLSLPLYLLAGLARRKRLLSQEAAMKYFVLGAFSSAIFLYGLAMTYGFAGSVSYSVIADKAQLVGNNDMLLYLGLGMLLVGLLFKVSAAPFHSWTPDVYQGSPTPVTAFMGALTKVSAFGALLRLLYVAFAPLADDWRPALWVIAILTMIIGAVIAITQTDVKRMLAYSSIAHAGFILVGVAAANRAGLKGTLFYLVAYGFTTIGAFAVVTLVRDADGEATHLSQWAGLGKRNPLIAGVFAFFLFALAGIPLTSGFMAKFAVFSAAQAGHATALVIVGVLTSAVAGFFYARVVVLMFFSEPGESSATVAQPSFWTAGALGIGLAVTVVLGVVPSAVLHLADVAGPFVR